MTFQRQLVDDGFLLLLQSNLAFQFAFHPGPDIAYQEKPEEPWGIVYPLPSGSGAIWTGLTGTETDFGLEVQVSYGGIGPDQVQALADKARAVVTGRNTLGKFNFDFPTLASGHVVKDRWTVGPTGGPESQESGFYQLVDKYGLKAGVTL